MGIEVLVEYVTQSHQLQEYDSLDYGAFGGSNPPEDAVDARPAFFFPLHCASMASRRCLLGKLRDCEGDERERGGERKHA
jgi:hypothetical protein